jgi:uroporphyrin-III C-methyltransferase
VVVYMAGRTGSSVGRRLIDAGRDRSTPVAVITAATTDQARIQVTDLAALAAEAPEAPPRESRPDPDPVLLVIGEVVRLRTQMAPRAMIAG